MKWTIVGLGNPTNKYAGTRHNAGRMVVDSFQNTHSLPEWETSERLQSLVSSGTVDFQEVILLKPNVYMNKSGISVQEAVPTERDQEGLIVVHDEIDLPVGEIQVADNKSAGGHNGVASIIERLGSQSFTRLRVGIAPKGDEGGIRKPPKSQVRDYVLGSFTPEQKELIESAVSDGVEALRAIIEQGREAAMNQWN